MRNTSNIRLAATASLLTLGVLLSGCSSVTDMFGSSSSKSSSNLGVGVSPQAAAAQPETGGAAPVAVAAAQQEIDCPSVDIRSGASTLAIANVNRVGSTAEDPTALELRYQGSIVRTARECAVRAGVMSMKVGVEGRIVVGPAGGPGEINVPIRLAVVKEGIEPKTIITKLYRFPVTVAADAGRANFTHVADDLAFPVPANAADLDAYIVYVGFDPQPEAKQRAAPRKPPARRQG